MSEIGAGRPYIILAEDDADQRTLMAMLLVAQKYEVKAVNDGAEALVAIKERHPSLLITDLMMPNMDGFQLVTALKEDLCTADIPILVLTVLDDPDKEYQLLSLGVDDYCEKTVQKKIILKRIENLLARTKD